MSSRPVPPNDTKSHLLIIPIILLRSHDIYLKKIGRINSQTKLTCLVPRQYSTPLTQLWIQRNGEITICNFSNKNYFFSELMQNCSLKLFFDKKKFMLLVDCSEQQSLNHFANISPDFISKISYVVKSRKFIYYGKRNSRIQMK